MKRVIVPLILVALFFGSIAVGQEIGVPVTEQDDQKAVQLLLRGYHGIPERSVFEQASPDSRQILTRFANDPLGGLYRDRAVIALGHWPDADTLSLYRRTLQNPTFSLAAKHLILLRGADVFGDRIIDDVAPFLTDDDIANRITAIAALSRIGTDAAYLRIDAHAATESDTAVLRALDDYGRRIR